ncbi:MAG TPA: arylesterase [Caulobacteraceae bacterium]|nr:arylesterase [Caulobacteraceae bacterium]
MPVEHLPRAESRRRLLALAVGSAVAPSLALAAGPAPLVTILGDSITAGYGLPASQAFPAQLQRALARLGEPARVIGSGVSGDTTADGLARLGFSVQPGTRLCIVALGGNDLLRGLDPRVTRRNLQQIVTRLKARRIPVLLAGVAAPTVIGPSYARDFDAAFASVARAERVPYYPDLLAGVYGHPNLIQGDGLHPNAAGAAVIALRLAPLAARILRLEGFR